MHKPNYYKLLSTYLKQLLVSPDGLQIHKQEFHQLHGSHFDQFITFLIEQCQEIGYSVTFKDNQYHIAKVD
jgi:hypothetical protein